MSSYEPDNAEIFFTRFVGGYLVRPFYRNYINSLPLEGNETVLDYGSGSGVCSRFVAERLNPNGHLTCVDISSRWLKVASQTMQQFNNVTYHHGAIWETDIPENSHQGVLVHFTLHDVPAQEQDRVFQSLCTILVKNGYFFLRETSSHGHFSAELVRRLAAANRMTEISTCNYQTWHSGEVTEFIWRKN